MQPEKTTTTPADIQFLWWRGCPSWERALRMLREQMAAQGITEESLEVIEIKDERTAERFDFPGSPTILVQRRDIQSPGPERITGLTCRVYRRRDGRISPMPDPDDISDAIAGIEN